MNTKSVFCYVALVVFVIAMIAPIFFDWANSNPANKHKILDFMQGIPQWLCGESGKLITVILNVTIMICLLVLYLGKGPLILALVLATLQLICLILNALVQLVPLLCGDFSSQRIEWLVGSVLVLIVSAPIPYGILNDYKEHRRCLKWTQQHLQSDAENKNHE